MVACASEWRFDLNFIRDFDVIIWRPFSPVVFSLPMPRCVRCFKTFYDLSVVLKLPLLIAILNFSHRYLNLISILHRSTCLQQGDCTYCKFSYQRIIIMIQVGKIDHYGATNLIHFLSCYTVAFISISTLFTHPVIKVSTGHPIIDILQCYLKQEYLKNTSRY